MTESCQAREAAKGREGKTGKGWSRRFMAELLSMMRWLPVLPLPVTLMLPIVLLVTLLLTLLLALINGVQSLSGSRRGLHSRCLLPFKRQHHLLNISLEGGFNLWVLIGKEIEDVRCASDARCNNDLHGSGLDLGVGLIKARLTQLNDHFGVARAIQPVPFDASF